MPAEAGKGLEDRYGCSIPISPVGAARIPRLGQGHRWWTPAKRQERGPAFTRRKYDLAQNRIFVSGPQAIVRLLLMQAELDRRAGLKTAGFMSGYRGSPLGGLDLNSPRQKAAGGARHPFPAGPQRGSRRDRHLGRAAGGDARRRAFRRRLRPLVRQGAGRRSLRRRLRHVNLAGTSRIGGVLALMGDDHTAESSTTAHQSEFAFVDVMMPILAPAGVQELIDYGLYGYALSRYSGCWVGLKCLKDTVELTASVDAALDRVQPVVPTRFLPAAGRAQHPCARSGPRSGKAAAELQARRRARLAARQSLNSIVISGGPKARLGIIAAGKSYLDVRQALDDSASTSAGQRVACGSTRSPAPGRSSRKACANSRRVSTRSSSSRKSVR